MRTREAQQLDEDLGVAMRAFHGSAEDRRIWASIAWRVGVEAFHFALMDKLAEDAKTLYWTHLKKMLNIFCGQ